MRRTITTSFGILSVLLFALFFAPATFAKSLVPPPPTTTWNGSFDNDWTNPSNWSSGAPIGGEDVTIGGMSPTIINVPTIALNSLTINAMVPTSLQSPGFASITLTGALTVTTSLDLGNQLSIIANGGGSVALGATLGFPGGGGNNLTNSGVFTVSGTIQIQGFAASPPVSGNDLVYAAGSSLVYQYAAGIGAPNTGAELPTLPNVMNGNLTVDAPTGIFYKMNGDKRITGACSFTQGNWNLNGYALQLDGAINIAWINHSFIGSAASSITIGGSGAIVGSMGFDIAYDLQNLTMNRAGAILGIVSASPLNIANTLNLLAGNIDCATYNTVLRVQNPSPTAVTGGASGSYVITSPGSGLLRRALPMGTSPNAFKFPVGTVSGYFPFTLVNPTVGVPIDLDVTVTDVAPSAPVISSHYLTVSQYGGPTNVDGNVLLESSLVQAGSSVAANTVSPVPFSSYTVLPSSPVIPGVSVQSFTVVSNIGNPSPYYFALAGAPTPPYVWAGAPGANWQTPSSWSPPRNNPAVTDELIFNAGTHTPTNVPHETVSVLTIKNGAAVTLSASNPNNWLTTTAMPYGVIVESGGKLDLGASATNIALNIPSPSQCRIDGTLQTQNSAVIGSGFFFLSNDALLATTRDDGINGASVSGGAIQTASASYGSQARYEFTSASAGAERDMNFKQQGGKSGITQMKALYVGASAGTRRLNSAIMVGGMALLAVSKSESSLQSAPPVAEVVIRGRTTLHSALNSSLTLNNGTPLTVRDGAELWNNGQISFPFGGMMVVDNAFFTMVGPNGGGGSGTGSLSGGSAQMLYSGASLLSYTGGGAFTTNDFILPSSMPVAVSVSNASAVTLNADKTLQSGLRLTSGGKVVLNNRALAVNGLDMSSGGLFQGSAASALTLNGKVEGAILFETGFTSLGTLTLNHATSVTPTLASSLNVLTALTLQSGILSASPPNILTLAATTPAALAGGSASAYIRGALRRTMEANVSTDGQTYLFPIGDSVYRPFTLANVRTGSIAPTVQGQSFPNGTSAWTPPLAAGTSYNWLAQTVSGNFLTGTFQVGSAQNPIPSGLRIATASAQAGAYGDIGDNDVSPVRSSLPQAATASANGTYFALGGAMPSIISFTPRTARPGQTVTIEGTFLSGVTGVSFGGVLASSFTVVSPTQITAVVGSVGASGSVQVQSPLGTVAAPLPFTWTGQPTITSVSPGLNVVGQIITIRGTEYHTTPAVSIGTQLASNVTAASLTELRVIFAQSTSGVLTVNASGGTVSWQTPMNILAPPTLTSFSPASPLPGGLITVNGTNFVQGTTQVSIGSTPAQATVNSPTQITVVAPQSANGLLQITTPAGTVLSSTAIVIVPPPTITDAAPATPMVGETIAILGSSYINVQTVRIGGIPTTFTVNSPTSISAIAPPFSASSPTSTATVSVTTRTGTATYARTITLRQAPEPVMTLTGFTPTSALEGETVTVTGLNVPSSAIVRLQSAFGTVTVQDAFIQNQANAASTISFRVPSGLIPQNMASTAATITAEAVFPSGVKTAQTPLPLTIRAADAPVFAGFSPNIGGSLTTLIISGQNFGTSARSTIRDVFIGGLPVQAFIVLSPTEIRVSVGNVASGALTIQTGSGVLTTTANFTFNPLLDAEAVTPSDSLALNALFAATNGALWTNMTNWTNGYPVALRFGVKVERGRVVELNLPANNLNGTLPWTTLATLTALRVLSLPGNNLQGSLPQNVCSMVALKDLNLSGNRFEGNVDALCCLPQGLENLNISSNQLSGFLPQCWSNLGNLQAFDAGQNRFIGGFPVFLVQLPSLQTLNLRGNRLSGILPPSLGVSVLAAATAETTTAKARNAAITSVQGLQRLDIGGNEFSGNIPAEMGNLTGLRELFLDGNHFAGAVPESFSKLLRLQTLNIAGNALDAIPNLPASIRPLATLTVGGNRLPLADLERLVAVQHFAYTPQTITPPRLADTSAVIDAPFRLRAALAGVNNRYQWLKNGVAVRTASANDALEFTAFAPSDAGEYKCEITNTKLPLLLVSTASIRVGAALPANVPDTVRLIAPTVAETDVPTLPVLVWRGADGAGQYRVEISALANFSTVLTTLTVAQTATALAEGRVELDTRGLNGFPLQNDTRYFWRVRAENARGAGRWSSGDFTTAANNTLGAMRLDFGKVPRRDVAFGVLTLRNLAATPVRLAGDITTSNPAFVCESIGNVEIPAESSLQVRVRFVPTVLETVSAAVTVRFTAAGTTTIQTQTIANRLIGRGGALKLIPPTVDTSAIGSIKLLAVQVVNVGDRETELVRVQLQRGAREYTFRAEVDGKAPVGVGDTTAVLLRFTAERPGAASAQEVYCQATVDTVTVPLVQYGRTKLPTDVVAKLGLRAIPESAPPGSEVMLEIYLAGINSDERARLFQSSIPYFAAKLRFNTNVLALGTASGSILRPIRNAAPENSFQRFAVPTTFWNGRDSVLLRIPCRAVAGNTDTTALVLEDLTWGDGALQVADVLEGRFTAKISQSGGKRLIAGAGGGVALVSLQPNPSADVLEVIYTLVSEAWTEVSLVDMRGSIVQTLARSLKSTGEHRLQTSLKHLPSGTYLLRLESAGEVVTRRVEVVR